MAKRVALAKEVAYKGVSVGEAIEKRRSERDFSGKPMSLLELSRLLHYAAGITDKRYGLRAAPSAGALYPIEVYAVVNRVEGLARGIYRYSVEGHSLELIREGDFRHQMVGGCGGEDMMGQANVVFAMTVVIERSRWRYQDRAYRYALFEAGHIAQNIYLSATAMGLGACAVGGFYDEEINKLLDVNPAEESAVYLVPVGKI